MHLCKYFHRIKLWGKFPYFPVVIGVSRLHDCIYGLTEKVRLFYGTAFTNNAGQMQIVHSKLKSANIYVFFRGTRFADIFVDASASGS